MTNEISMLVFLSGTSYSSFFSSTLRSFSGKTQGSLGISFNSNSAYHCIIGLYRHILAVCNHALDEALLFSEKNFATKSSLSYTFRLLLTPFLTIR